MGVMVRDKIRVRVRSSIRKKTHKAPIRKKENQREDTHAQSEDIRTFECTCGFSGMC
jgi:hypothetical protein